jgi:hypothetical protein
MIQSTRDDAVQIARRSGANNNGTSHPSSNIDRQVGRRQLRVEAACGPTLALQVRSVTAKYVKLWNRATYTMKLSSSAACTGPIPTPKSTPPPPPPGACAPGGHDLSTVPFSYFDTQTKYGGYTWAISPCAATDISVPPGKSACKHKNVVARYSNGQSGMCENAFSAPQVVWGLAAGKATAFFGAKNPNQPHKLPWVWANVTIQCGHRGAGLSLVDPYGGVPVVITKNANKTKTYTYELALMSSAMCG